jgi:hypothetical protein
MRVLGVTLVTLALVLGAGGVARRPLADTSSAGAPAQGADAGTCKPSPPPRVVEIDLSKHQPPPGFVSLNSRGYNYRQPGDPPQIIPDSTGQKRPEGVQP